MNPNSKKRKVIADKWIFFGLKWSPYENSSNNAMGITNYVGTSVPVENGFKKSIAQAVDVFRLYLRQKSGLDQLVQSPFSAAGLAVAVGKNLNFFFPH